MNITKMIDSIADQAHIPETDEDFIADDGLVQQNLYVCYYLKNLLNIKLLI